jgi:hypothetical protein
MKQSTKETLIALLLIAVAILGDFIFDKIFNF